MESQLYLFGGVSALLMGATLGVFGAGGSILTVPLLVFLFQIAPSKATHYSLLIVGLVSAFGLFRDRKGNSLPLQQLAGFAIPAMIGMYLMRNLILPILPQQIDVFSLRTLSLDALILFVFALFMILASISMIFMKPKKNEADSSWLRTGILSVVGLMVGMATGFVGAGGGFLIVPALVFLAGFSVLEATRASLFVIMLNSLWGFFTSRVEWNTVPWSVLSFVVIAAFAGMMLGLLLRSKIQADKLKPAFGVFVLLMGTYVLWKSF